MFSIMDKVKQNLVILRNHLTIHNSNDVFVTAGGSFQLDQELNNGTIAYICAEKPQGSVYYSRTIENVYHCQDCNGKLIRQYNQGEYSLTKKGNYYRCTKCEKLHSPLVIEKTKNNEILN
ncbi:hypothetical protein ACWOFR_13675 [Carnobacterium gallinarum]|uniref:hypothetical protein n=1 Tax=Carnobacterium gallinarum TaxID=2749 RepID=UPI000556E285|nr:hypothetical protein [Carnobacterium gallinarum]